LGFERSYFAPPYGQDLEPQTIDGAQALILVGSLGYFTIGMDIDPRDWVPCLHQVGKVRTFDYQEGHVGYIPAEMARHVQNLGEELLCFLALFRSPRFADFNQQALGLRRLMSSRGTVAYSHRPTDTSRKATRQRNCAATAVSVQLLCENASQRWPKASTSAAHQIHRNALPLDIVNAAANGRSRGDENFGSAHGPSSTNRTFQRGVNLGSAVFGAP
jgi:hypothetical protein